MNRARTLALFLFAVAIYSPPRGDVGNFNDYTTTEPHHADE